MTSQILKFMDFTKTQKTRYLGNETFFKIKQLIAHHGLLYGKNTFVAEFTFKAALTVKLYFSLS